ncbi:hypothetical protein A2115_01475 [Candidatus Woesebacteria bacterium GWA1_41_8]|uniref:Membrane protein 6-pyruvoyl-tetrahydropterin synthase-related domain-containing protein n=1 Tax=Candidatus Woesebacteria bacterium GWA1_41_8 TaxID=1802471 RepID=A0A1F7WH75_9BACT|nr:MAG: hypothetical protein A2115_01475 [Candidatus Woesebacteria bacterium GWA1_41_8]
MTTKAVVGRLLKLFSLSGISIVRLAYFAVALLLIVAFGYLFGFHILVGVMKGGDAGYAVHNLLWFSRWFPRIPVWYPLQGAGFAMTLSYPVVQNIVAIFIDKLSPLSLVESYKMLVFGSFIFAALGVYLFGAWRMKSQTLGTIAALFYLAMPGTFFWVTKLGYYAFAIGSALFPWGLVFFDVFLENVLSSQKRGKVAISLFLASLTLGLSFMFHAFVGAALSVSFLIYGALVGYFRHKNLLSLKGILKGILAGIVVSVTAILLWAFWFFPVFRYAQLSAQLGKTQQTAPADLILRWAQVQSPERLLFDWGEVEPSDQFPLPPIPQAVTYLALASLPLSLAFAFGKNRYFEGDGISKLAPRAFGVGMVGILLLFTSGLAKYIDLFQIERLRPFFTFINFYVVIFVIMLVGLAAASAVVFISWIISEIPVIPAYFVGKRNSLGVRVFKGIILAVVALAITFNIFFAFEKGPEAKHYYGWGPPEDPILGEKLEYGYKGLYFRSSAKPVDLGENLFSFTNYSDMFRQSYAYSFIQEILRTPIKASPYTQGIEEIAQTIVGKMQLDQFTRVGLTGNIGNVLQVWGNVTDASTLNQFMFRGSLFQSMRGFSETVFFGKDERNHRAALLNDLARYIGYKYVVTSTAEDTKHYQDDLWTKTGDEGAWQIFEFKDYQGMVTITQRPQILVIGAKKGAYESVLMAALEGVVPYQNAWLVEGGENIDDYSLKDLKPFGALILYGYSYKDQGRAFSTLERYIKEGGNVFMDTGWQFISKDWELPKAPEFLPVEGLSWQSDLPAGKHKLNKEQGEKFGMEDVVIEWQGKSWGVSEPTGFKSWAEPLLSLGGKEVAVGGRLGRGKIIWSGLNLFGYMSYQKYSPDSIRIGKALIGELFSNEFKEDLSVQVTPKREFPDRVELNISGPLPEGSFLLWREPYSPDWSAKIKNKGSGKITTFRAGPGFLLLALPATSGDTQVILEYKLGLVGALGKAVSVLTLALFILWSVDEVFNGGKYYSKFMEKFIYRIKFPKISIKNILNEEE